MALQDILDAISKQSDEHIALERSASQKRVSEMRETSERTIAKRKQEIAAQKEDRKLQMLRKSEAHSSMTQRNAELKKKQELLDSLYELAAKKLSAMPADKVEALLKRCVKSIKAKGEIRPSAKHKDLLQKIAPSEQFTMGETVDASGGFIFVSKKEEHDCTFEHLVAETLRPATEVETAHSLFSA